MLSAAGGCELSTTTRVKTAWKKFKDLLPVLFSRHLSFKTRGSVYSSCVRSAMLHASETWPLTKPNLQRLQRNDRAMIRQICNVRPQDIVTTRSSELLVRLGTEDLDLILKERRFWWYGHVERSNGAVKTAFTYRLMESVGLGGPKWHGSSWQRGIAESGSSQLSTLMIDVPGDLVWDLPCVQQASYLERGPLMWMLPLYLHVNQKSDYMIWWWWWVPPLTGLFHFFLSMLRVKFSTALTRDMFWCKNTKNIFEYSFIRTYECCLSSLGNIFSTRHIEIFFIFFPENGFWFLMQIVSSLETICMKCQNLFSGKIRKISVYYNTK